MFVAPAQIHAGDVDALYPGGESGPLRIVRVTLVRGDNTLTID